MRDKIIIDDVWCELFAALYTHLMHYICTFGALPCVVILSLCIFVMLYGVKYLRHYIRTFGALPWVVVLSLCIFVMLYAANCLRHYIRTFGALPWVVILSLYKFVMLYAANYFEIFSVIYIYSFVLSV